MSNITNTNHLILLEAAKKLGIKTKILHTKPPLVKYSYQNKAHLIREKSFGLNKSKQAKTISRSKALTLKTLKAVNLPVPQQITLKNPQQYITKGLTIPFPQVIKPLFGEKGKSVYLNIKTQSQGQQTVNQIFKHSPACVVETYHQAKDYRFLVLNHKLIGLAQRLPPRITGNGHSTIKQLIKAENQHRLQLNQKLGKRMLNRMRNWKQISLNLKLQNLSLNTILPQKKTIQLYPIPNFSTGGSVKTIDPKTIHPSLVKLAQAASQTINLNIIGIDILIKNLKKTIKDNAVIIELNSDPGVRLHDWPNQGRSQHTAEKILKYIFKI